MSNATIKKAAHELIDALPDTATWEDLMHTIYVRQAVENGLADSKAGKVYEVGEVRKSFGLDQ